jgi:hypothetical protein
MGLGGPSSERHDVQILTSGFQFAGQLETLGPAGQYINQSERYSLSLYDVHLSPLTPGSPLKGIFRPHAIVLRSQVIFLYLASEEAQASVSTFTRKDLMMIYTPIAVCRGYLPMPAEARIGDFLSVVPGELLPVIDAQIFPFKELPSPFPLKADLMLMGRSHWLFYHPA